MIITREKLLFRIRFSIVFFMLVLILSGVTAFPVYSELEWLMKKEYFWNEGSLGQWLNRVWLGVKETQEKHGFLFYGYDWLGFAHLVIAMAFIGPYRDPVKNKWVIEWAMLCCLSILPLAFIVGSIRGIPWFHILIDCSFGILGILPLWVVKKWIAHLEETTKH